MKKYLVWVFLLLVCSDAHGQLLPRIFRPRDNYYPSCPGPNCPDNVGPYSPSHPGLLPQVTPNDDHASPDIVSELEKVIPPEVRVQNKGPNCGWCALEDIMVAAGYQQFKGIRDRAYAKGWHGNTISDVKAAIRDSGVECIITENRDWSIFDYARKEGVGVYVQIPGHALVCLAVDEKRSYMLDNNGPLKVQTWPRAKFNQLWDGVACCPKFKLPRIFKPKDKPADKPKDDPKPEVKPVKPCDCPKDQPGCKCDNKSINDALTKLTEVATLTNKSVGDLSVKVSAIDQRLVAVEGKLAGEKPATPPPPSAATPDPAIKQIQDELDKLKKNLNGSATLRVTVIPK